MKNYISVILIGTISLTSCEKDTGLGSALNAQNITHESALIKVSASAYGVEHVSAWGVTYGRYSMPTTSNTHFESEEKTHVVAFEQEINNLAANSTYYARVYMRDGGRTHYGDEISFNTPVEPDAIGSIGPGGGTIFYKDGSGGGLEMVYMGTAPAWGCASPNISSCTTNFGAGSTNTWNILNACPSSTSAPALCAAYENNGLSDWYLPSYAELNLIRSNLYAIGAGGLIAGTYASSSQGSAQNYCYGMTMSGANYVSVLKTNNFNFCAVRTF